MPPHRAFELEGVVDRTAGAGGGGRGGGTRPAGWSPISPRADVRVTSLPSENKKQIHHSIAQSASYLIITKYNI